MLWAIAAMLVTIWLLGLMTGFTMGLFIHILIAAAIVLLVISVNQEASIYQELKETLRVRGYKKVEPLRQEPKALFLNATSRGSGINPGGIRL